MLLLLVGFQRASRAGNRSQEELEQREGSHRHGRPHSTQQGVISDTYLCVCMYVCMHNCIHLCDTEWKNQSDSGDKAADGRSAVPEESDSPATDREGEIRARCGGGQSAVLHRFRGM